MWAGPKVKDKAERKKQPLLLSRCVRYDPVIFPFQLRLICIKTTTTTTTCSKMQKCCIGRTVFSANESKAILTIKDPKFTLESNELLHLSSILKKSIDLASLKAWWCVSTSFVHFPPLYVSTSFPSIHHDPTAAFLSSLTSNSGPPPDEDRPGCKSNFHDSQ